MRALLLAGGRGSRLHPLTLRVPRCLIPIQGRPVIHRVLQLLRSVGLTEVVVNTNVLADKVQEALGQGERHGVTLTYSHEHEIRGIGAAILAARPFLENDDFVIINGDVVIDLDLADVLAYHQEQKADVTLVLRPDKGAHTHGPLDFDNDISLSTILGESPDSAGYLSAAGIRVATPRLFDFLGHHDLSLSSTLTRMVKAGCHIEGYVTDSYWADLSTWEKYGHILWELNRGFVPDSPTS